MKHDTMKEVKRKRVSIFKEREYVCPNCLIPQKTKVCFISNNGRLMMQPCADCQEAIVFWHEKAKRK